MTKAADDLSPLGVMILVWMLTKPDGDTKNELGKALRPFLAQRWSAEEQGRALDEAIDHLVRTGRTARIRRASLTLTKSGRSAALEALGVKAFPRTSGRGLLHRLLLTAALGILLSPGEAALPRASTPSSPKAVEPLDDKAFAARVLEAARASKTGRFGENKVFISHVFRRLVQEGTVADDADAFKARLVAVHRGGLLSLSRADLVEAMDPEDVAASEARYLSAVFNFVRI